MTATDAQVRIIMREREKGRTQEQAAASANVSSRKTVAKHERLRKLPSEVAQPRGYRTRADPFVEDLPTVETMLESAPSLEAKALFEWLCEQHPERYQAGQLRTFQRRVRMWRALHQEQVAMLEQVHRPGEVLETDGTWLSELGVTIWHVNADEPRALDYNEEYKSAGQVTSLYSEDAYRSSDRNPVIVGLELGVDMSYCVCLPLVIRG